MEFFFCRNSPGVKYPNPLVIPNRDRAIKTSKTSNKGENIISRTQTHAYHDRSEVKYEYCFRRQETSRNINKYFPQLTSGTSAGDFLEDKHYTINLGHFNSQIRPRKIFFRPPPFWQLLVIKCRVSMVVRLR